MSGNHQFKFKGIRQLAHDVTLEKIVFKATFDLLASQLFEIWNTQMTGRNFDPFSSKRTVAGHDFKRF